MGKVAIAGGTSNVGREVSDRILAKGNHDLVILTRQIPSETDLQGAEWVAVDYHDVDSLTKALTGVDTILSFIAAIDPEEFASSQINLIDAAVKVGVRRFAPSEWACKVEGQPHIYAPKDAVRKHLQNVNTPQKKLEYCLFQPGWFTNYLANGRPTSKHFHTMETHVDFEKRRAMQVDDGDYTLTLTTVEDTAEVVALALDYPGVWPTVGGIRGTQSTMADLIALGEKLRGPFQVSKIPRTVVESPTAELPWLPHMTHGGIPEEAREMVAKIATAGFLSSQHSGAWSVSDEWNKLLPNYKFESAEEYLSKVWSKQ